MIIRRANLMPEEVKTIQNINNVFYFYFTVPLRKDIIENKVFIAEENGIIIGILIYGFNTKKKIHKIKSLIVKKDYRGKGIGRKLFNYFLKNTIVKPVIIEAMITNDSKKGLFNTKGFWEKIGFIDTDQITITKKGNQLRKMIYLDERLR